jgi:hypothetical protein
MIAHSSRQNDSFFASPIMEPGGNLSTYDTDKNFFGKGGSSRFSLRV